jgi:hypothetical protein
MMGLITLSVKSFEDLTQRWLIPKCQDVFYPWGSEGFHTKKSKADLGDECQGSQHALPAATEGKLELRAEGSSGFSHKNGNVVALSGAKTLHLLIIT